MAGWLPLFAQGDPLSARSVININFTNTPEYRFINHWSVAEQLGPVSSAYTTGTPYPQVIDSSGLPNIPITTTSGTTLFGGGVKIPASWQYGAVGSGHYYVFEFDGNCTWDFFIGTGSFTYQAGPVTGPSGSISSSNVTVLSGSSWRTTSGANTRIIFNYTGPAQLFTLRFLTNDPNSAGANVRNIKFYRLDDILDLQAGKVFRTPYKQQLVDLCPSAIRFMDWHGGNSNQGGRFSTRRLPSYSAYDTLNGGSNDWYGSPAYGAMSFTDGSLTANQYAVAAATGTTGNAKTTPGSMQHLEVATIRADTTMVRGSSVTVTGVSNASTGVVTAAGHVFNNGDIVILIFSNVSKVGSFVASSPTLTVDVSGLVVGMRVYSDNVPVGTTISSVGASTVTLSQGALATANNTGIEFQAMPFLQHLPIKVTNKTINTFEMQTTAGVAINTTALGAFGGTCGVTQFTTLNIGGRGAYPISLQYGTVPVSYYGNAYITASTYGSYVFDKSISLKSDGAGNQIMGVWRQQEAPGSSVAYDGGGVPLEICTALVNEVNAMSPVRTVNMWANIPFMGMSSMDPDYTAGDNWGIGIANVVLNGANGYSGLTSPAKLFIEYGNETWNSNGLAFSHTPYLARRGVCRWFTSTPGNYVAMAALRSVVAMNDITNSAYYNSSRVKRVLAGQGTDGITVGSLNQLRIDGSGYVLNDAIYPNASNAPMFYHDYFAFAGYFFAGDGFDTANLSTLVTAWVSNISNASAQEANCSTYVDGIINVSMANVGTGDLTGGETTTRYATVLAPQFAAKMLTYGKSAIMYEGGWNKDITMQYNIAGVPYITATLDGSTTTITGIDPGAVSAATVGDFVFGYGILVNTKVSSKPAGGTSLVLSNPTTVAQTYGQISIMSPQNAFLWAVKHSTAWKNAYINFMGAMNAANLGMPADYIQMNIRWGHLWPTSYGYTNAEWTDVTAIMTAEGARNRALST